MTLLVLGLALFFAPHLLPTFRPLRGRLVAALGGNENVYKAVHGAVAMTGLVLIVVGFGDYRAAGMIPVWTPPVWTQHLALTLMLPSFIVFAAMPPRPSLLRYRIKHPMLAGIKIWALAHLLANGDLGSIALFGSFLAFGVYDRISVKRRGLKVPDNPGGWTRADTISVIAGTLLWLAFLFGVHHWLIGVPVLPGVGA
ncbi:NnrU family protein [Blastochloris sulfoviridis]|uniref:NnrU family protein n=1 Tax=Blastochloris sulfoviridis TaxID=50712 RepID=A0A5M6I519_9HYPH|nr:NnrU family protein [Blastochloris sulfoviridis]KAA5602905.1 NnrU family protein [Blastochloris sulfoviridis]